MTSNIKNRWCASQYAKSPRFYASIQHHGWDNFESTIVYDGLTFVEACEIEIELIRKLGTTVEGVGYNLSPGGNGGLVYKIHPRGMLGKRQTDYQKHVSSVMMSDPDKNPMTNGTTVFGKTVPHPFSKNVEVIRPDGKVKKFFTIKECADYFGFSKGGMGSIIAKGTPYRGNNTELYGYVFKLLPMGAMKFERKGEE